MTWPGGQRENNNGNLYQYGAAYGVMAKRKKWRNCGINMKIKRDARDSLTM